MGGTHNTPYHCVHIVCAALSSYMHVENGNVEALSISPCLLIEPLDPPLAWPSFSVCVRLTVMIVALPLPKGCLESISQHCSYAVGLAIWLLPMKHTWHLSEKLVVSMWNEVSLRQLWLCFYVCLCVYAMPSGKTLNFVHLPTQSNLVITFGEVWREVSYPRYA